MTTKWYRLLSGTNPGNSTQQNSSCKATFFPSSKIRKYDEQETLSTVEAVITMLSYGLQHMDTPAKTYIHQLCTNTGCEREDLLSTTVNKDGWWGNVKEIYTKGTPWWIYTYKNKYILVYIYYMVVYVILGFVLHAFIRPSYRVITINHYKYIYIYIYQPLWTRRIQSKINFKQILTGSNTEFSFSLVGCHTMIQELSSANYLPVTGVRIFCFIPFRKIFAQCET